MTEKWLQKIVNFFSEAPNVQRLKTIMKRKEDHHPPTEMCCQVSHSSSWCCLGWHKRLLD